MRMPYLCLCAAALGLAQGNPPLMAPGTVTIPVSEYNAMVEQAERHGKATGAVKRAYSLATAEFRLTAGKTHATGVLEARGAVTKSGLVIVPLAGGIEARGAARNGSPVPLLLHESKHAVVIEGPAEFAVTLDVALPIALETGRASLTIPAVGAGIVKVDLSLAGEETAVQISPGWLASRESKGGRTAISAALVPGRPGVISWNARMAAPSAPVKELRFLSSIKTLISAGEADLGLSILGDVTVIQGEASRFELDVPEGFELTGATGATVTASSHRGRRVTLDVSNAPSHQFLVTLSRAHQASGAALTIPGLVGSQRETGELLVEGEGALELTAKETGGLRRMDLREVDPQFRSMASGSLQSAFRYQRRAGEAPALDLAWVRFPAASLAPALASRAAAVTMVTREGRALTEIRLTVRNQSRMFARVALPPGASILTADVGGGKVKPAEAPDGARIPLLRPGFRPTGPYEVSFVVLHPGAPFAKRGSAAVTLPKFDLPVGAIEWEVFLPEEMRASGFGGNVTPAMTMPRGSGDTAAPAEVFVSSTANVGPGQVGGTVIDPTGAVVPSAVITVTHENGTRHRTISSLAGTWAVPPLPAGQVTVRVECAGFKTTVRSFGHQAGTPLNVTLRLEVGNVSESVEVSSRDARRENAPATKPGQGASANVLELQKKLSGVLPVAVTVPRTGVAYHFVRTLVVDDETKLTYQYKVGK